MACANLAGWLLARSVDRRHELGIRAALGADRWQLIRPVLFESTATAMIGSAIGAVVAPWISAFLVTVVWTGHVPVNVDLMPDLRIAAFMVIRVIATAVLAALPPGWRSARTDAMESLRHAPGVSHGAGVMFRKGSSSFGSQFLSFCLPAQFCWSAALRTSAPQIRVITAREFSVWIWL